MEKLVKLDENGALTEIDPIALRRTALELKEYIENAPDEEAKKYQYFERVMPLIKEVLDNRIQIPYHGSFPYSRRLIMEGFYPELVRDFSELYLTLKFMIIGYPSLFSLSTKRHGKYVYGECEEIINGEKYEWCWFED